MKIIRGTARRLSSMLSLLIFCCAIFLFNSLIAQTQPANQVAQARQAAKKGTASVAPAQNPGERKFQANCSRCHTAPEQISPRITGTVVRHMRVRASLSAEDERDILRYLSP